MLFFIVSGNGIVYILRNLALILDEKWDSLSKTGDDQLAFDFEIDKEETKARVLALSSGEIETEMDFEVIGETEEENDNLKTKKRRRKNEKKED